MIRFTPVDVLKRAGTVARHFSLEDVTLHHISATRTVPFLRAPDSELSVFTEDTASAALQDNGESLVVTVNFKVVVRHKKDGSSSEILTVDGAFELTYVKQSPEDIPVPTDKAELDVFASVNGTYNAWPYIREAVSSMFMRLGYLTFAIESLMIIPEPPAQSQKSAKTKTKKAR